MVTSADNVNLQRSKNLYRHLALWTVKEFLNSEEAQQPYPFTIILDAIGQSSTIMMSLNAEELLGFDRAEFRNLYRTPEWDITTASGSRLLMYESADDFRDLTPMIRIPGVHVPDKETADKLRTAETLDEWEMVHVAVAYQAVASLRQSGIVSTSPIDDDLPTTISVRLPKESCRDVTEHLLHIGVPLNEACIGTLDGVRSIYCQGTSAIYDSPDSQVSEDIPSAWRLNDICVWPIVYLSSCPTYYESQEGQEGMDTLEDGSLDEATLFDLFCVYPE